jgi:hypothetical protein
MVFSATFNNISVILLRSVLLVEETGVPGENQVVSEKLNKNVKVYVDDDGCNMMTIAYMTLWVRWAKYLSL